jgi:hypothetical protein
LDGPQDVNLGFALTIWDQIFHRAVFPTEASVRIDTGLPGRPLVVEQAGPRPRHFAVLAAQLVAPFRPSRKFIVPPSIESAPPWSAEAKKVASTYELRPDRLDAPSGEMASW